MTFHCHIKTPVELWWYINIFKQILTGTPLRPRGPCGNNHNYLQYGCVTGLSFPVYDQQCQTFQS